MFISGIKVAAVKVSPCILVTSGLMAHPAHVCVAHAEGGEKIGFAWVAWSSSWSSIVILTSRAETRNRRRNRLKKNNQTLGRLIFADFLERLLGSYMVEFMLCLAASTCYMELVLLEWLVSSVHTAHSMLRARPQHKNWWCYPTRSPPLHCNQYWFNIAIEYWSMAHMGIIPVYVFLCIISALALEWFAEPVGQRLTDNRAKKNIGKGK